MARGTQHRKRRPAANAPVTAKPKVKAKPAKQDTWEDQLFFPRLRRHAKPVFFLLALFFALTFVFLGVGSGSTGIGDALTNFFQRSSGGGSNTSKLEKKTRDHPKDAQAWRDLATAQETNNDFDDAIVSLTRFTQLRPKSTEGLESLGGLYLRNADNFAQDYSEAQAKSASLQPGSPFKPAASSPLAQALTDPIASGIATSTSTASSDAYSKYVEQQSKAVNVYKKLARLNPADATNQYRLAQVAQAAGNNAEAITAYTAFLKLAPNDPLAPSARKTLKQLKKPATAPTATATTTG